MITSFRSFKVNSGIYLKEGFNVYAATIKELFQKTLIDITGTTFSPLFVDRTQ